MNSRALTPAAFWKPKLLVHACTICFIPWLFSPSHTNKNSPPSCISMFPQRFPWRPLVFSLGKMASCTWPNLLVVSLDRKNLFSDRTKWHLSNQFSNGSNWTRKHNSLGQRFISSFGLRLTASVCLVSIYRFVNSFYIHTMPNIATVPRSCDTVFPVLSPCP